ncbi:hypothetical protein [Pseudarthrobacter sp. DSP2-3-2b1]|uniref:hypothetical protein n=1 Tax=Pseudarthrobacter sp. DSP2-3-2b1 TaxID=2804661 RepID=UPI003CEA8817
MKRAITTLGVVGLALFSVAAPASADNEKLVDICHDSKVISVALNSAIIQGHVHKDDIIAPNEFLPSGFNWTADGLTNCGVVVPPIDEEPVNEEPVDEEPVDEEPVDEEPFDEEPGGETGGTGDETGGQDPTPVPVALTPAAVTPAPPAAAPKAVAKVPAAAVSAVKGTNQGYNAQTSVGGAGESTTWLAGLGVLLGAGALVALRHRSRTESPTAG